MGQSEEEHKAEGIRKRPESKTLWYPIEIESFPMILRSFGTPFFLVLSAVLRRSGFLFPPLFDCVYICSSMQRVVALFS